MCAREPFKLTCAVNEPILRPSTNRFQTGCSLIPGPPRDTVLANSQIQDNRPQATAHLAKTMAYLQLSAAELEATLLKEIDANPALELVDELRCPECGRRLRQLPCPACAAPKADGSPVAF